MVLTYFNKTFQLLDEQGIKGVLITYEISEDDMFRLASIQDDNEVYYIRKVFIHKENNNCYDLICDNIEAGRIMQGGLTSDSRYVLSYYIIQEGLQKLLSILSKM